MKEEKALYTVSSFINLLSQTVSGCPVDEKYVTDENGILKWTEEQDVLNKDKQLDRKNAARLLHMYMKCELGIKDVADITSAYELRDLFDCRVCVNHIAQVYLRGLMNAVVIGDMKIFDSNAGITESEAIEAINKLSEIVK
jgi:hypothetical protein